MVIYAQIESPDKLEIQRWVVRIEVDALQPATLRVVAYIRATRKSRRHLLYKQTQHWHCYSKRVPSGAECLSYPPALPESLWRACWEYVIEHSVKPELCAEFPEGWEICDEVEVRENQIRRKHAKR